MMEHQSDDEKDLEGKLSQTSTKIFTCHGYVNDIIGGKYAKTLLALPNGQEVKRLFKDNTKFIEAGVFWQGAPFVYEIVIEGHKIVSYIYYAQPTKEKRIDTSDIDFSVFDEF